MYVLGSVARIYCSMELANITLCPFPYSCLAGQISEHAASEGFMLQPDANLNIGTFKHKTKIKRSSVRTYCGKHFVKVEASSWVVNPSSRGSPAPCRNPYGIDIEKNPARGDRRHISLNDQVWSGVKETFLSQIRVKEKEIIKCLFATGYSTFRSLDIPTQAFSQCRPSVPTPRCPLVPMLRFPGKNEIVVLRHVLPLPWLHSCHASSPMDPESPNSTK